jgi:CxxC motif-containing protein (DUF1111 family)
VQAPASTKARDGLGPHFIARSCGGCHFNDGRGAPPEAGEQPVGLLLRLSMPGVGAHGGVMPEPVMAISSTMRRYAASNRKARSI